jgi:riboflavin kinase/FMN adenylyltransferase
MNLRVARNLDDVAERLAPERSVVTLGVFDGVHRGHARIIAEVLERKSRDGLAGAYLITFDPHPATVVGSRAAPAVLTTIDERLELFARFALDGVFVVPFDAATARLGYREFIDRYLLSAMDMRHLVLGYDHHFGYRREGTPDRVAEEGTRRGFGVTVVDPVEFEASVVSSTQIRRALGEGDLGAANRLLGHPYLVGGRVVPGQGRGADLGFPTANVAVEHPRKLWPPAGVYAVRVDAEGAHRDGMMNVGTAPTIKGGRPEIEVHIFDFDGDLYGRRVFVHCVAWLRPERRFRSPDELASQLGQDRLDAEAVLETRDA